MYDVHVIFDNRPGEQGEIAAALEQAIAAVAATMADPSRVKMLCALMDGRAWTATELSVAADVAPSTASGHLARLVEGKLITCLSQGRHRYYRLAGHDVAALVEQMMGLSWSRITSPETSAPKPCAKHEPATTILPERWRCISMNSCRRKAGLRQTVQRSRYMAASSF